MNVNVIESEFCCKRDGLIIRGREFRPEGKNLPIMIASHGFGGNLRHMIHYCETFASWGYTEKQTQSAIISIRQFLSENKEVLFADTKGVTP